MKTKFYGFAIATLMAGALASCSNDVKEPAIDIQPEEDLTLSLVRTPDVFAWSGKQILGDTRSAGTRAENEEVETTDCGCGGYVDNCNCGPNCECANCRIRHNEEIEANLTILNKHEYASGIEDLATKLSVHVRTAVENVDIRIPVPSVYVIESDDLYIFNEHYVRPNGEYEGAYGGSMEEILGENLNKFVEYQIGDNIVKLSVNFLRNDEIQVFISGVNQQVIDYCWEHNQDGLNFEVYNYYQKEAYKWVEDESEKGGYGEVEEVNEDLTREALKEYLDGTTIEFYHLVSYYINSFGYNYVIGEDNEIVMTEDINPNDCYVKPKQAAYYGEPLRTTHLNGSPFNDIYVRTTVTADDAHNGGNFHHGM